jgi:LysR family transcriptional regulator, hypochlorite-specific transcription factor HypT
MKAGWLDDLLALASTKSLTEAAYVRNVTQPAFTRRVQQIEQALGLQILDRSVRPARVTGAISRNLERIRSLQGDLRLLTSDLRRGDFAEERRFAVAAQHSLTISVLSQFVANIAASCPDMKIRLNAANREDCYAMLMTRQVSMIVAYETNAFRIAPDDSLLVSSHLADDMFCPVAAPSVARKYGRNGSNAKAIPLLSFPEDTFFGQVFRNEAISKLAPDKVWSVNCETAMAPAIMTMAIAGAGVAWLPHRLCKTQIESRVLIDMTTQFPAVPLRIVVSRRRVLPQRKSFDFVSDKLREFLTARL